MYQPRQQEKKSKFQLVRPTAVDIEKNGDSSLLKRIYCYGALIAVLTLCVVLPTILLLRAQRREARGTDSMDDINDVNGDGLVLQCDTPYGNGSLPLDLLPPDSMALHCLCPSTDRDDGMSTPSSTFLDRYERFKAMLIDENILPMDFPNDVMSCSTDNTALLWLTDDTSIPTTTMDNNTQQNTTTTKTTTTAVVQRYVATQLFVATTGTSWHSSEGWLSESDVCGWHGIDCTRNGLITSVHLPENGLEGSLPLTIGALSLLSECAGIVTCPPCVAIQALAVMFVFVQIVATN